MTTVQEYHYRGRNADGQIVDGFMIAESSSIVAHNLIATGVVPIDIIRRHKSKKNKYWMRLGCQMTSKDRTILCRQLYSMLNAGISIDDAMQEIITTFPDRGLRRRLKSVAVMMEKGFSLSESMGKYPELFSEVFINMVRAGEETGKLNEVFFSLSQYFDKDQRLREKFLNSIRYPTIVFLMSIIAIIIISIFVIPVFGGMLESSGVELPLATKIILEISEFLKNNILSIMIIIMLVPVLLYFYPLPPNGKLLLDKLLLRTPKFGALLQEKELAHFARILALTVSSGVPVLQGLVLAGGTIKNKYLSQKIYQLHDRIKEGESLFVGATEVGMFPPIMLQMLKVGEKTGEIDDLLNNVAVYYESEVESSLKNINVMIEPLMLLMISVIILIIGLGVILPYFAVLRAVI